MTAGPDSLLTACLTGDARAWQAFVDRYARLIHQAVRIVISRRGHTVGNSVDEELTTDIAQDVFVKLIKDDYRLLRLFDPTRASLVTYLTIIARTTTIDELRRRRVQPVPLEGLPDPPARDTDPADTLEGAVEAHIPPDLLTDRQKLVLHLLFDQQMSVPDVAQAVGIDPQTVRTTKHKAVLKLRRHFGIEK